ncbi:MAG: hypothetical protein JKP98_15465 [Rhodobacteraceae bacterium]|nr:hypothetical protein [Paracoccaceae bacterium]
MHDLENGLAGPVELDAASGAEGAAAPDWVTLLPAGPDIAGRSGRRFQLPREAAEAVVAAFRTNGADLPVDLEHSTEIKGPKGEAAPAVGWIKELRVTGAGAVEGRVDWTGAGRGLLAERADRYLSPSVLFDRASRTIRRLVSAGLTNKPDFRMPALAREDGADGRAMPRMRPGRWPRWPPRLASMRGQGSKLSSMPLRRRAARTRRVSCPPPRCAR